MAAPNTNVIDLLQQMSAACQVAKQFLVANDKTNLQTTMTSIASLKSTADTAISAQTNVDELQGIQ